MSEYITKEQAWEVVKIVARHGGVDSIINADKALAGMPAADVAPVVHARWEHKFWDTSKCTACNREWEFLDVRPVWKYCPNCGARMDGDDKPQKEIPEEYSREPGAGGWDCSDEEYNYSGYVRDVINGGW